MFLIYHIICTIVFGTMVFRLLQGILAAVLSGVLGTKDPEQVNTMAKQAGEVI